MFIWIRWICAFIDDTWQESNIFVEIVLKENMWIFLNCVICQQNFKRNTVKTKCFHYYCSDYLSRYFRNGQSTNYNVQFETILFHIMKLRLVTGCLKCNFATVLQINRTVKCITAMRIYLIQNALVVRYILWMRV